MYKKDKNKGFSGDYFNRTQSKGFSLQEGKFRLDIKKTFFKKKVVVLWHRLPREMVDVPFLETFKVRLEEQPDLVEDFPTPLLIEEGLDKISFKGPMVFRLTVIYCIPGFNHIHPLTDCSPK